MDREQRQAFNAAWSEERHQRMLGVIEREAGFPADFRISETPLFLDAETTRELVRAGWEIATAVTDPAYLAHTGRALPPGLVLPARDTHTSFLQVDFALALDETDRENGRMVPRLIELQGFPSLYAFQWLLERAFRETYGIPEHLTPYFDGLDETTYGHCLRDLIVAGADPETVILLEVDPETQKTRVDFACTERLIGVPTVGLSEVIERGGRLYYHRDGRDVPITRIYNRVIFDELERKGLPRDLFQREHAGVTWLGHPGWYFRLSKFALPYLKSRYAPPAWFLSDVLSELPEDLESYVLKPLFSFAGLGVELGPTPERLRGIRNPEDFILQRKVDYAPAVETLDVPAKAEVRMMFVWDDKLRLINNLVRMSKGKMMGVDFNRDLTWIGGSLAYHPVVD
jgi:hypothetical protein